MLKWLKSPATETQVSHGQRLWLYALAIVIMTLLVILMSAMHGFNAVWVKEFANDLRKRPQRFYRMANEVPTLLMIGIVILVVVKPF